MGKKKKKKQSNKKDLAAELRDSANKIWLAGVGAVATAEKEGSKFFQDLVQRGENYSERGREQLGDVKHQVENAAGKARNQAETTWSRVEDKVEESVTTALGRLGVPSKEEISTLTRRVAELTAVVEQLQKRQTARTRRTPARKTTTRKSGTSSARKTSRASSTAKSGASKSGASKSSASKSSASKSSS